MSGENLCHKQDVNLNLCPVSTGDDILMPQLSLRNGKPI